MEETSCGTQDPTRDVAQLIVMMECNIKICSWKAYIFTINGTNFSDKIILPIYHIAIICLDFVIHAVYPATVIDTVTIYGVLSHKASHTLRPLLICCASPASSTYSFSYSFLISLLELSGNIYQQSRLVAK
jgi:hypothetical protein